MKPTLKNIVASGHCLGCGLCASLAGSDAIAMTMGADGFIVPHQLREDVDVSFLRDVCPGITVRRTGALRGPEKIYGRFEELYRAHATDEQARWAASSGGGITALLLYMLEQSLIDAVLHIGKADQAPLQSSACVSRTRQDVIARAGSRYAPSSLLSGWMTLLQSGERFAVVGKPCDIVAVSQFLALHPEYRKQVVCTISFMCMGLPSMHATTRLIDAFGLAEAEVADFWYRGHGWPGKATAIDKSGRPHDMSYQDSWGRVLSKGVKFRCKICPDGFGEFADISFGDAWYSRAGQPVFDEQPGESLAFVRTPTGRRIFDAARERGYLQTSPFDVNELKTIQRSQFQRKTHLGVRLLAVKLAGDRLLKITGFPLFANLRQAPIISLIRNVFGTLRRCRAQRSA